MTKYETVYILEPSYDEVKAQEMADRVSGWIKDLGGDVVEVQKWGKRRLAYEIRKRREIIRRQQHDKTAIDEGAETSMPARTLKRGYGRADEEQHFQERGPAHADDRRFSWQAKSAERGVAQSLEVLLLHCR